MLIITPNVSPLPTKSLDFAGAPTITADGIAVNTDVMQEIKAPIAKNQVLGKVTYEADGLIYSTNIVAARDVEKKPFRLYNLLAALGILITVFIISAIVKNRKKKKR